MYPSFESSMLLESAEYEYSFALHPIQHARMEYTINLREISGFFKRTIDKYRGCATIVKESQIIKCGLWKEDFNER